MKAKDNVKKEDKEENGEESRISWGGLAGKGMVD